MSDVISRQAAIDAIDEIESEIADGLGFEYERWRKYFCDLPPAQPERIKGRWMPWKYAMPGKEYKFHKCSVCGTCDEYVIDVPRPNGTIGRLESIRNFCPNCGADMREVADGNHN